MIKVISGDKACGFVVHSALLSEFVKIYYHAYQLEVIFIPR